ncbi:DUF4917 family protein [Acinetobacter variabilis]|uniref:Uncharacterized protein n=1 Tax=Acinetobacter variabilis TaxID=70346 RepID=N9NWA3_9GAMM|nr:DUF4917 family protein [Acinetobacter variabilis]ENX06962.1 hypothetical protein F897_02844 [Acinetobacter variabilis]
MYGNKHEDGHKFKDCFQANGLFRDNWQDLRNPIRREREVTLALMCAEKTGGFNLVN